MSRPSRVREPQSLAAFSRAVKATKRQRKESETVTRPMSEYLSRMRSLALALVSSGLLFCRAAHSRLQVFCLPAPESGQAPRDRGGGTASQIRLRMMACLQPSQRDRPFQPRRIFRLFFLCSWATPAQRSAGSADCGTGFIELSKGTGNQDYGYRNQRHLSGHGK